MKKTLATALLAISPITLGGTLTIPQEFEFVAINGKSVTSSMFSHNDEEELKDGENKIAIQYKDLIREDIGDGHTKVKSAPFIITFDAQTGTDYKLKSLVSVDSEEEARAYAEDPKVNITDSKGGKVKFTLVLTEVKERGLFNQIIGHYPDSEQASIAATGGTPAPQPVAPASPSVQATAPVAAAPAVVVAPAPTVANQPHSMLQYWWQEADSATRNAFTGWAVQHLVATEAPKASNSENQAENMLHYWFLKADEATRKTFMSWAIQNL